MDDCIDYGSELMNKVYGGELCNSQLHGDLPLTGMNFSAIFCVGVVLLLVGAWLYGRAHYFYGYDDEEEI